MPPKSKPQRLVKPATSSASTVTAKVRAKPTDQLISFENAIKATPVPSTTRERILHAAVSLLHEQGFPALTQQQVCARAGVRQSHLTYYFPTRNDLLRETAVFGCEALLTEAVEDAKAGDLTLDKIRNLLFVADESDRKFGRLMAALIVASDEDPNIKPWLASFEVENRAKMLAMFHGAGVNVSTEDIELLHAAYVGAVLLDIGENSEASIARAQRIVHRAFDFIVGKQAETPRQIRRSKASTNTPARRPRKKST